MQIEVQSELNNSFEVSNSQYEDERYYASDENDEDEYISTGVYNTKILKCYLLLIGLFEDDVSIHVSTINSASSLLETSNASINSENNEAQTHTSPGLSLLLCVCHS